MWDRRDPTEKEDGDMAVSTCNSFTVFDYKKVKLVSHPSPLTMRYQSGIKFCLLPRPRGRRESDLGGRLVW